VSPQLSPPGFGAGRAQVVLGSKRVLTSPYAALIFWGSYWSTVPAPQPGRPAPPDISDVLSSATMLIKAQFFSALSEYGVGPFQAPAQPGQPPQPVQWTQVSGPGLPPAVYGDADIRAVVVNAIRSGAFTTPQDCTIYCVITGPDAPPPHDIDLSAAGYHQTFTSGGQPVVYAYIRGQDIPNNGVFDGSLALITTVLGHELAEAATDPFIDAVRDPHQTNGEIGDICGAFTATVGGVDVAPYWSQAQNLCVTGGPQIRQKHSGFCVQSTWQNAWNIPAPFELFVTPQNGLGIVRWRRYNIPQPLWQDETIPGPPAWTQAGTFEPPAVLQSRHGLIGFAAGALYGSYYEYMQLFRVRDGVWTPDAEGTLKNDLLTTPPGLAGRPAIIQSDGGSYGNYEVVLVLTDGSINHYTRDNDGQYNWSDARPIPIPAVKGDARVALMQASFQSSFDAHGHEVASGAAPGSLHAVVQTGGRLYHALFTGGEWLAEGTWTKLPHQQRPQWVLSPISVNGTTIANCAGTPGLIETRQGKLQRNFHLVTAKTDGSIAHYTRENDTSPFTWRPVSAFAAGDAVAEVSLFQSTFPGSPLEVAGITQGGRAIFHYRQSVKISPFGASETWTKEIVVDDPERMWKV